MTAQMSRETIALTPAGRLRLEQELGLLRRDHLPALLARLSEARDDGAARDEDAGLLELLEEHGRVEHRVRVLERLLTVAREIAPPGDGVVGLGSRVEIEDDDGRDIFQLVDPCEANPAEGRISVVSPVGRALLGRRAGDAVIVPLPAGERRLRIVGLA